MGYLDRPRVLERFRSHGRNSSHFVWLLSEGLRFFETSQGWIFAFQQLNGVTLLPLEPLIPGAPTEYDETHREALRAAWAEFTAEIRPETAAFVAVYGPFAELIRDLGFRCTQVGQEPWMDLSDCIPKGNAGKGVRNARNQALHSGLKVEEWKPAEILVDRSKQETLREIHAEWSSARLVNLSGFLNSSDPFAQMEERRYFVVRSPWRIEAYLIASPVPGIGSWFLEDMVIRRQAPRGAGELLTLDAMVSLRDSGGREASLGVVSMTTVDASAAKDLPPLARFCLFTVPKYMRSIYNFSGMEVYRKRFKPRHWQSVHLGVWSARQQGSLPWLRTFVALGRAFRPRLQLTPGWLWGKVASFLSRYPLSASLAALHLALFAGINHFGRLPEWALTRFGFSGHAPLSEWLARSVVSDALYFDLGHFLLWGVSYFLAVAWAERTHKRRFIIPFVLGVSVMDDFVNYVMVVKPFEYFQPAVFRDLIAVKDVGSSLGMATLLGLQICQFRKAREPLFALAMLGMVLAFAFTSSKLHFLVMNLNHTLLFTLGYLAGKLDFEYRRHLSRKVAKGKPPEGRTVLPPPKKAA